MSKLSKPITALLSVGLIAALVAVFINRLAILDYLALRNYSPNSRVVALADDTTMTDGNRRVFYINHPALNNKSDFRDNCPSTEQSIVLGCYVQHRGIYLLDVDDKRLNGVVQVTAAHEVLHAQYDRLSKDERKHIDSLLSSFYSTLKDDRINKTIEQYRSKDPSIVPNEMHSIIGTEVRDLTPELESYYSRYFKDRSKIVSYSENYEQTFVSLDDQVKNYDKQLSNLKEKIDSNREEIDGKSRDIELTKNRLDSLLNSDRTEEYNASVPEFNAQVNEYNSLLASTRSLINQYNSIVEKRNAIVTTEQELAQSINSNVVPAEDRAR